MDGDIQSLEAKRKILKKLKKLLEEWNGEFNTMEPEVRQYFDKVDKDLKNLDKNLMSYFEKLNKEFEIEEKEYQRKIKVKEKTEHDMQAELNRQEEAARNEENERLEAERQSAEATTAEQTTVPEQTAKIIKEKETKKTHKTEKEPTQAVQKAKCKNDDSDEAEETIHTAQLAENENYPSSVPSPLSFHLNETASTNQTGIVDMQALIEGPYPSIASDVLDERRI